MTSPTRSSKRCPTAAGRLQATGTGAGVPPPTAHRREAGTGAAPPGGMTRLFIGAGREAGVRPQDLVGAITGEAGIAGREVGAIEIADRFSLVEVADAVAEDVIGGAPLGQDQGPQGQGPA